MDESEVVNMKENKPIFTVKNVLRVLSLLCIIFVFCPSFLVSCSGQNMKVSVMTAVGGISVYGEKVVSPHPIMLVCLLIPTTILVLLFIKKFTTKKIATTILACSVVDLTVWFIFRATVKKMAEENYCTFKTTGWYFINIIVLIFIILLTALVVANKIQMNFDLISKFTGGGTQSALNQMSATMSQMSSTVTQIAGSVANNIGKKTPKEDTMGFCFKCGSPIAYGCKFCTSCGTPVPESMLADAQAAKKAAEEEVAKKETDEAEATQLEQQVSQNYEITKSCQQCGAKLELDAMFCESCGKKVE